LFRSALDKLEADTDYTISFEVRRSENATGAIAFHLRYSVDGGTSNQITISKNVNELGTDWTRLSNTEKISSEILKDYKFVRVIAYYTGKGTVDFRKMNLVQGNKAPRDWTPAPEDIEQRFSHAETDIKQNAERILAKAEKDYVDTLTDSISKDVAQLDIKYNEITTTVNNIEIGVRNLIKNSENIPKHFGNGYSGANAEYTKVDMTDEWGFENAYEVKTTGGTNTSGLWILSQHDGMVMNQRYVYSVYIKNIGTDNIKIYTTD